ncbi:hypothetical protein ASG92_11185 [Arthrobacter sp. Soil736]|nr:hypothetical protein ASG92_11185 [Arthrobacter sp. Soil736]
MGAGVFCAKNFANARNWPSEFISQLDETEAMLLGQPLSFGQQGWHVTTISCHRFNRLEFVGTSQTLVSTPHSRIGYDRSSCIRLISDTGETPQVRPRRSSSESRSVFGMSGPISADGVRSSAAKASA